MDSFELNKIAGAVLGHFLLLWLFSFATRPWELGWQGAVVLGGAIAMSSTAIIAKLEADNARKWKGFEAPYANLRCVAAAAANASGQSALRSLPFSRM